MSERYHQSEALLARALKTIPLGSQTFSKSKTQYPHGVSPFFMVRGKGCRSWDVDGNEYVDWVMGLDCVNLGYCDPDVTAAVSAQLLDGQIFSLPHPLEMEVAERLVAMVPGAEMVRFGKNGSDATSGAIRLARAHTNRDHVAVCGYHGWQDWYIGSTTRNRGVPQATRDLTHTFTYNNLPSLEKILADHPGNVAAVILEPMNAQAPVADFLAGARDLAHRHGALFIFDETITGFRYANGGAAELFGITPDLATFGKGLANGYPVSAVAGRADIMHLMEEIFFSFTFGGETLSLAAAKATLDKLQREPVVERLAAQGQKIIDGLNQRIRQHDLADVLSVSGHPSWSFLNIAPCPPYTPLDIRTLMRQEMFARGILFLSTHNLCYSHGDEDIARLLAAHDEVLPLVRTAVREKKLHDLLRCQPLQPLFAVR